MTTTPITSGWRPWEIRWEMFMYGVPLVYAPWRKGPRSGPRKGMIVSIV